MIFSILSMNMSSFRILLFQIFSLLLVKQYSTTECICYNYECPKQGARNCYPCKNVPKVQLEKWNNQIKLVLKLHRQVGFKGIYYKKHLMMRDRGIHCCKSLYNNKCFNMLGTEPHHINFYHLGPIEPNKSISDLCSHPEWADECCHTDYCNVPSEAQLRNLVIDSKKKFPNIKLTSIKETNYHIYLLVSVFILCILMIVIIFVYCFRKPLISCIKKFNLKKYKSPSSLNGDPVDIGLNEDISCSGSGGGKPIMIPKTTSSDITLISMIGNGRYGRVWLGKWNDDDVAVKIICSRDEASWASEKRMYNANYLRHANILAFITADSRDNVIATELWLVTEYHERGSLYDVLKSETVTLEQAIKMARSITNGLAYLHMDINGIEKKPAIAHRDLKSRNVLVKSCGECCIGDLGMALRLCPKEIDEYVNDIKKMKDDTENHPRERLKSSVTSTTAMSDSQQPINEQDEKRTKFRGNIAGTKRYMAPEILDCSLYYILLLPQPRGSVDECNRIKSNCIDMTDATCYYWQNCIDSFKRADIYSYSLILWEIASRIEAPHLNITPSPYQLPYENLVGSDPDVENMWQVVCQDQIRPSIDIDSGENLTKDIRERYYNELSGIQDFCQTIRECWFPKPTARLGIMRLKKTMSNISTQINKNVSSFWTSSSNNEQKIPLNSFNPDLNDPLI